MPRKAAKVVAINIAILVLLFIFVEGAASATIIAWRVFTNPGLAEQYHSRHDETLGWVALPNVHLPDHYGPGAYLRTNSHAFRSNREFTPAIPAGKIRIICSGDSFTLGFGVSNDETWCERLSALDPRVETVNMGQGGYGVDQAYLWYMRDGVKLDHNVLLFAFIPDDFSRVENARFQGYAKPLLDVQGDSIAITNHPVRPTSRFTRWRAANGHAISNLMFIQFGYLVVGKLTRGNAPVVKVDSTKLKAEERVRRVSAKIFERLNTVTREKNARLVLVMLAGPGDYRGSEFTAKWQPFVREEAAKQGIPLIDFIEPFRRIPPPEQNTMFLPNSHYSAKGNEFVAKTLLEQLAPVLSDSTR